MESAPRHLAVGVPARPKDFLLERRHRVVSRLAPPRGDLLLDFGCGNGAQTLSFASEYPCLVGVDVTGASLVELARRRASLPIHPVRYGGDALPFADASFDRVMSFEVLEHVRDEGQALAEMRRVLRPGGTLVLSVPNRWWIFETHGADLPLLPWNRVPFFSWLPKAIHDRHARARIYRRREIVALIRRAGFDVNATARITAPMDVVPFAWLRRLLRATLFGPDTTPNPVLATSILVVATRPDAPAEH